MIAEDIDKLSEEVTASNLLFQKVKKEIGKVIVGQNYLIDRLLIALLTDGHLLLEGHPGLAKTLAVNTLAKVIDSNFQRIQFTPDLLPADLIGTTVYNPKDGTFTTSKGPLFSNIILADEINRAPPKVQSALLEVMQERQITIGTDTFLLNNPFLVLATQNPIEHEGTYHLPEAQTDRFIMKIILNYPSRHEEKEIISRMSSLNKKPSVNKVINDSDILNARNIVDQIYIDEKITEYILDIIFASRHPKEFGLDIAELIEFGASPRATLMLTAGAKAHAFLNNRAYVIPYDVKSIVYDILRHRLPLSYEAHAADITTEDIIDKILNAIELP